MEKKQIPIKKILILTSALIFAAGLITALIYWQHQRLENQKGFAEKTSESHDNELLKSKNYAQYQIELTDYADTYTDKGEYGQAERVLQRILNEVPEESLTSETYRSYWHLYYTKKDTANRQKYARLTAEKLKQEGKAQQAAQFEKDAQGN
jgi:predicted Zn-dependent protease